MANFHSDAWAREQLDNHLDFARMLYPEDRIVGIFCQGSTNYGLDVETSDFDTKCIVVPSFKDIALMRKPVSITHILDNNEHCDGKDVRLYMETFRKQNLNFLEILFTDFYVLNPDYREQWMRLVKAREDIARMNEFRAVKSMKGIAMEKFHAMEHKYPTKIDIINAFGYDGKQVSHLLRVDDYLTRYIAGESYKDCLKPSPGLVSRIMDYKLLDRISLEGAREEAKKVLAHTVEIADDFCARHQDKENQEMRKLLEDVSYNIMKTSVEKELLK